MTAMKPLSALAIAAMLTAGTAELVQGAGLAHAGSGQDHAQDHGHAHDPAEMEKDAVRKGFFEDGDISARSLADWEGDWQSVYPHLASGALDPVMARKAETGEKSAEEYRAYYETGYKTDVDRITIQGDRVAFHRGAVVTEGIYAEDGHEVLTYEKGNRGVRFIFERTGGDAAAPRFIQFSDHRIAPERSDHYHLYWGDDRAALLEELTNWPTYFPAALSVPEIVAEMTAH